MDTRASSPPALPIAPLAPVAALLASVAILVMGNGLQSTLLPVRASLENFSDVAIGLMGSAYYLGFVLGCLYGGPLIQRVGHIRAFTALASVASTVALVHAVAINPFSWSLMRALTGFCFAGLYLVIETWLNDKAENRNRGFIMGVYTMVNLSVLVVGQLMLMLDDPNRFPLFAYASILVSLAAVPVALTRSPQPAPFAETRIRLAHLYRLSPVGLIGAGLVGVVTGAFWSLGPAFAADIGSGTRQIALFMAIGSLGGALTQWPLGRLSDRLDRRIVLLGGCVIAAIAALAIVATGKGGGAMLVALSFLFGAAALPLYAICAAHAFDYGDRSDFIGISSGLLLANGAGSIAGPLVAAAVMTTLGPGGLFMTTAAVHVAFVAFVLWRMTQRSAPAESERTSFDLVSTASTMVALEPGQAAASAEAQPAAPAPAADESR